MRRLLFIRLACRVDCIVHGAPGQLGKATPDATPPSRPPTACLPCISLME